MIRRRTKKIAFTRQGIGERSSRRREGAKGGGRLHGLGPWSGEGTAPTRRGDNLYSAVYAGASPKEEPFDRGLCD